jgi:serine/threonine protein kinase
MSIDRLKSALAGHYGIEREIGAGGMATVYLAHDIKHDRKVAVKVLRAELAAVLGAERFLQEIKVTANLQHPHILPLHDSGAADSPSPERRRLSVSLSCCLPEGSCPTTSDDCLPRLPTDVYS